MSIQEGTNGQTRQQPTDVLEAQFVIRLLGGFQVVVDGVAIADAAWSRRKARSLVKLLALAPALHLHREEVLEALWPEQDPDIAGPNLRVVLHAARRALAKAGEHDSRFLRVHDDLIWLAPETPAWIDVVAFEAQAAKAMRSSNVGDLVAALDLYRGDLLPEDRYEDWCAGRRERIRDTYLAVTIALAVIHERAQRYPLAIELLRRAIQLEPSREEAHVALMRIYWDLGQRQLALRHYTELQLALRGELGIEPEPATQRLYAAILAGDRPLQQPATDREHAGSDPPARRDNLPSALTSFIGRDSDIDAVCETLRVARLVTVTGIGGSGKTRLALAVAGRLANEGTCRDGVWLVELAALTDPELIEQAVARAIGVEDDPRRSLAESLRDRQLLLVLDNCEHLIDACARLVTTLLRDGSEVRVLATSREALAIPGEVVWSLAPLSVPPADVVDVESVGSAEAVQLFVERARFRHPPFVFSESNAAAIADICRRVEGLPLAIELAAARAALLSPEEIATRLDDTLGLLASVGRGTTPRHQSMRGVLDWSYQLLDEPERALLAALAVFEGGWTLDAAEAVMEPDAEDVLDLLSQLVDKSLVVVLEARPGATTRYSLLGPVRQYAGERLRERGDAEALLERHAHCFLRLAEEAHPQQISAHQTAWLDRLEREHDNLRAALRWAIDRGEVEVEARLCSLLWRFWYFHGHLVEGERWLNGAIERSRTRPVDPLLRGLLLQGFGATVWNRGDLERTAELNHQALALFQEAGDLHRVAATFHNLGLVAEMQMDSDRAERYYGDALRLREQLGDSWGIATTLQALGNVARNQGRFDLAAERYERSLTLHQEIGNTRGIALAMMELGVAALDRGNYVEAEARAAESLEILDDIGDKASAAIGLGYMGYAALLRGALPKAAAAQTESLRLAWETGNTRAVIYGLEGIAAVIALANSDIQTIELAVQLYGTADALRVETRMPLPAADLALNARSLDAARARLGEGRFAAAWANGATVPLEEAVRIALAKGAAAADGDARPATPATLSPREQDVARLAAQDYTNQQIADQLGMSVRTAETHLRNLLRKLSLSSRRELAGWFASQHPGEPSSALPTDT